MVGVDPQQTPLLGTIWDFGYKGLRAFANDSPGTTGKIQLGEHPAYGVKLVLRQLACPVFRSRPGPLRSPFCRSSHYTVLSIAIEFKAYAGQILLFVCVRDTEIGAGVGQSRKYGSLFRLLRRVCLTKTRGLENHVERKRTNRS